MKTRIQTLFDAPNHCEIAYTDEDGIRQYATYWAPQDGGYVRDTTLLTGTQGPPVCRRLSNRGETLMWSPKQGPLVQLIRREFKSFRAAERRRIARSN